MSGGVAIAGFGHYAPDRIVTSTELERALGLEAGWIAARTGIQARRYAAADQSLTDLADAAASRALDASGIDRAHIALTLLATSTPDHLLPPSAPLLVHKLRLANSGGVDLAGACAGFLYALALGDAFVRAHQAPVLIVAANILSRRINPADRGSAILFADAAGAVVLVPEPRANAGVCAVDLQSRGADYGLIHIPAGGSRQPFDTGTAIIDTKMAMSQGRAVFQRAIDMMVTTARTALTRADLAPASVDFFIPHQANGRMIEAVAAKLGIFPPRTLSTVADYGNSSAATIPLTLSLAAPSGGYRPGQHMLLTAAGAGLTGGSLVWRW